MPGATTASEVFFDWRDRLEAVHDAPDRAEQADEGAVGADRGQEAHVALLDRSISRPMVTPITRSMRSCRATCRRLGGDHPLETDRRHSRIAAAKIARHRIVGLGADPVVEVFERHARPERVLERLGAALQPAQRRSGESSRR
jgi:hypothetical protein